MSVSVRVEWGSAVFKITTRRGNAGEQIVAPNSVQ